MTWRHVENRHITHLEATPEGLPEQGFLWWDLTRDAVDGWERTVERLTGNTVVREHVTDASNEQHPPFYDGTGTYDMLIAREVARGRLEDLTTSTLAVFLFDRLVVTVHDASANAVSKLCDWMGRGEIRVPAGQVKLVHRLLNVVTDDYMGLRRPISSQLEEWRGQILDPAQVFDDWRSFAAHQAPLRRLESLCEQHVDMILAWRDDPLFPFDEEVSVRFNDLVEHFRRVLAHVQHAQAEIDSLVQLHFAATAHRTNEIMKMLTLIAAIFLPLGLVAGVFGMNFQHMPGMDQPWAYPAALIAMLAVAVGMVMLFRRKHWL